MLYIYHANGYILRLSYMNIVDWMNSSYQRFYCFFALLLFLFGCYRIHFFPSFYLSLLSLFCFIVFPQFVPINVINTVNHAQIPSQIKLNEKKKKKKKWQKISVTVWFCKSHCTEMMTQTQWCRFCCFRCYIIKSILIPSTLLRTFTKASAKFFRYLWITIHTVFRFPPLVHYSEI